MKLIHMNGDLFSCPNYIPLAHCVSRDFRMSRGIAVSFQQNFNLRNELLTIKCFVGDMVAVNRGGRFICQLVTKERCFHKPRVQDLHCSLVSLRRFMETNRISEIAIPKLSAGLDQIPLHVVIDIIYSVFHFAPVTIFMYHL